MFIQLIKNFKIMLFRKLRHQIKNNSGFTLLEILIASAIATIILVMVNTSYRSIMTSIKDISGYAEFYENINLVFSRIDRDLSNMYLNRKNNNICLVADTVEDSPRINFVTADHQDMNITGNIKKTYPKSDIREVGYFLKDDPLTNGLKFLIRREGLHFDDDPLAGGEENIILENVESIKFEFRKRKDWVDHWDTREVRRFPGAVKTTLKVKNYRNIEEEFVFITLINLK